MITVERRNLKALLQSGEILFAVLVHLKDEDERSVFFAFAEGHELIFALGGGLRHRHLFFAVGTLVRGVDADAHDVLVGLDALMFLTVPYVFHVLRHRAILEDHRAIPFHARVHIEFFQHSCGVIRVGERVVERAVDGDLKIFGGKRQRILPLFAFYLRAEDHL